MLWKFTPNSTYTATGQPFYCTTNKVAAKSFLKPLLFSSWFLSFFLSWAAATSMSKRAFPSWLAPLHHPPPTTPPRKHQIISYWHFEAHRKVWALKKLRRKINRKQNARYFSNTDEVSSTKLKTKKFFEMVIYHTCRHWFWFSPFT